MDERKVTELDPTWIREALRKLARSQPPVFGANGHHFRLNRPIPERDVAEFEGRCRVILPSDYRHFITRIGNGGAGPYYGFFPLGYMDGVGDLEQWQEGAGLLGILSRPFPLTDAWNDLSGMPSEELRKTNEEEYERQLQAFEHAYFDSSRVDGAIPLCHQGCALRIWLVVAGPEAGYLWDDGRASDAGLAPVKLKDGSRATFSSWYREWLEEALRTPVTRKLFLGRLKHILGGA